MNLFDRESPTRTPRFHGLEPITMPLLRVASRARGSRPVRIATYSPGMVGLGHLRRNASIAQALRTSELHAAVVMIAEAWQAGSLPMPAGVDCLTLPSLRKDSEDHYVARYVDIPDRELIDLRRRAIRGALEALDPDVLLVDHLPLGAAGELTDTLESLRARGRTRCVLGLRDVLQDRGVVRKLWADRAYLDATRRFYDAVWVYSDPAVCDLLREHRVLNGIAGRVRFTGYLDQRPRLEFARSFADSLNGERPTGRFALCLVGGGFDGATLIETFLRTELPPGMTGVVMAGPYLPDETRQRLRRIASERGDMQVIDFLPDAIGLVADAERIISMGGYNTICEILSLEKRALIVPRISPGREQWIRARRLAEMGLLDVLHPSRLAPDAIAAWLRREPAAPLRTRSRVDLGGLSRIPGLLAELLDSPSRDPRSTDDSVDQPWPAS